MKKLKANVIKFVLLTTQRSGATFFLEILSNHHDVSCRHQTVFTQDNRLKFFSVDRPSSYYYKYRSISLKRQIAHILHKKNIISDCLNDYCNRIAKKSNVIGIKISYNHIKKYPAISNWITDNNIRIIHLIRKNILKTIISHETSKIRSLSHSTQKVPIVKIHINANQLMRKLKKRKETILKFKNLFQTNLYMELEYENLLINREKEMRNVLKFLDLDQFNFPDSKFVKLNPDSLKKIISNFDEIYSKLKNTEYEKFLT